MAKALIDYVGNLSNEQNRINAVLKTVSSGLKSAWTTSGQDLEQVITDFDEIKSHASEVQTKAEELISEIEKALAALDAIGIVGGN